MLSIFGELNLEIDGGRANALQFSKSNPSKKSSIFPSVDHLAISFQHN